MDELLFSIDASFRKYGIVLEEKQKKQFEEYCNFLLEYNEKVNLTAITDRQEVIDMHFADSLAAMNLKEIKTDALCADIGTGAGFPGVPLAIARPDITVALVDSLNKRLVFLNELKERLGLKNVYTVHGRSEDLGRDKNMRGKFDCVFSRAVARLNILLEYDIPFAKKDGYVLAWKGPAFAEEVNEAQNALKVLGARVENVYSAAFDDRNHFIVSVKKTANTPEKYPRQAGTPKKQPL